MTGIDKEVGLAKEEIGYMEKASAQDLDSKTGNAGDKNFTKYARDVGHANGYAWCMTFVVWLLYKAWGKTEADRLLCGKFDSASTMDTKDAFNKAGRLVPISSARRGDIVFRSRNGGGHVGLCIGRTSTGGIITIEGNTSANDATAWNGGMVAQHDNGVWTWCARPDYKEESKLYTPNTWQSDSNGWWYAKSENSYAKSEWMKINKHWYYFDERGYSVTGHQMIDGKRYYFETSGDLCGAMMVTNDDGSLIIWEEG